MEITRCPKCDAVRLGVNKAFTWYQCNTRQYHKPNVSFIQSSNCLEVERNKYICYLNAIKGLIGNVNHATKTGENDALFRGQKLNDIRDIVNEALSAS